MDRLKTEFMLSEGTSGLDAGAAAGCGSRASPKRSWFPLFWVVGDVVVCGAMGDVEDKKSPKPELWLQPRCGAGACGAGAAGFVVVGDLAGRGSKKLPPPPKDVVV